MLQPTDRNDAIRGFASADLISGGKGDDSLYGNAGSDTLDGGAGDDLLDGGLGQDVYLFGIGSGQDTITQYYGDAANPDIIKLGQGISSSGVRLTRSGVDATLSVQGSTDTLKISSFFPAYSNVPNGLFSRIEFSDGTFWGQAEINSHFLMAGGGSDDISIAPGNNSITGSDDNDSITAPEGNDTVWGGLGKDWIYGAGGDDQLWGGRMDDELRGASGNDSLFGERGNDHLFGEIGQDVLDGGVGDDTLNGGAGADTYLFAIGSGSDTVSDFDASSGVTDKISLDITPSGLTGIERKGNNLVLSYGGSDTLTVTDQFAGNASKIELFKFSDGTAWSEADFKPRLTITGDSLGNSITGFSEVSNRINGWAGNDTLTGGALADTIDGGTGADRMVGGDGDDVYVVDDKNDVVIETAIFDWDKVQAYVDYVLPYGVEYLDLMGAADLNGWSNDYGGGGILMGNYGNNHLHGGVDSDFLDGGNDGIDTLEGGDGDDFYAVTSADVVILEGSGANSGHDVMEVISWGAVTMADNVEDAIAANKYFALRATGNQLGNLMTGANNAADVIKGAAGNDTLKGLGNNDALTGGTGDDSLIGGMGSDKYYFAKGDGKDVIVESQVLGSATPFNDSIIFTGALASTDIWVSKQGSNLQLNLLGGNDQITVTNWFKSSANQVESISISSLGKSLDVAGINALVGAMASFAQPVSGLSSLTASQRSQVESAIAANWR